MTTEITLVPKEHIGNIWHAVSPWLDKAIARTHGRYHNVDILTSVIEGNATLWLALRDKEIIGSLIFTLSIYPTGMKVGRIDYIAGKDRDDWFQEMWDEVVAYSKHYDADVIEMIARPGTAAYVAKWGGKEVGRFYEYNLKDKSHG